MEKGAKIGPIFTATECTLLTHLAKKYVSLIENKKTDSVTWREKKACWERIASEFNCASINIPRSADTLRKKWDNINTTIKDKMAGQRKYALGTGGGPPLPSPKLNDDEKEIFDIIQLQVTGIKSYFDSDQDKVSNPEAANPSDSEVTMEDLTTSMPTEVPQMKNGGILSINVPEMSPLPGCSSWSTYSPSILRTPRAPQLEKSRATNSNGLSITDPLRRYRKRPHIGTVTNKLGVNWQNTKSLSQKRKLKSSRKT